AASRSSSTPKRETGTSWGTTHPCARARSVQVLRLHPHAEARPEDQPAQPSRDVGFLVAQPGEPALSNDVVFPTADCRAATATCMASARTRAASSAQRTSNPGL